MRIDLTTALQLLKNGAVIAVPTDTVYGLAADWKNPKAIEKIFQIKKRPLDKPLIVLFSKFSQVSDLIKKTPVGLDLLMANFWPGALTLTLPVYKGKVLPQLKSETSTTGFRMPNHPDLLKLLDEFGPIVAPSANTSGEKPALSADQVEEIFGVEFPVLDGGVCKEGIPSTILGYENNEWRVLREGSISSYDIFKTIL